MPVHRRPELIAHRGMPRRHRENTLPGFLSASALGADGWELDVHGSADGVVVVHHDSTLPESAGALAGRRIADLQWLDLRAAIVGPAGERLPTLDEVLAAAPLKTTVYVEVKAPAIESEVMDCLRRYPDTAAAVHSFDHRVALRIGEQPGAPPVGILSDAYLVDSAHALRSARARDFWPHHAMIDAALVAAVHGAGGRVIAWTVNDVAVAHRLHALGVDAVCTDVVDEMRRAFGV